MLKSLLRLARARDGNFAMITALLALPVVVLIGFASDYATMSRTRTILQSATDAAVLAVAREGANLSQERSEEIARSFLSAQLRDAAFTFSLTRDGTRIILDTQTDAGTRFDRLFGGRDWTVKTSSTSELTTLSFEIGLILDTTGSMKGGKLQAMKDAVTGMIDSLSAQVAEKDKLKFALIPFSTFVNVGPQYGPAFNAQMEQIAGTGADWLDLDGSTVLPQSELSEGASRFQLFRNLNQKWPGCVETRYAPGKTYDIDDTPASAGNAGSEFVPVFAPDEPDIGGVNSYIKSAALPYDTSVTQKKLRWDKYGVKTNLAGQPLNNGLLQGVLDLLGNLIRTPIAIDTSLSSYWQEPKGPGVGCSSKPIVPLSSDLASVKAAVLSLEAAGNTNITEGVAWGARVLSPGAPFTEGASYAKKNVRKILVVLTDGTNTLGPRSGAYGSYYSSYGYLSDGRLQTSGSNADALAEAMNKRTLAACTAAKDAGMEIYTIRLEEPNVKTGTMLQQCATTPANYFDVPNRSQLDDAFKGIKDTISTVRLAS